MKLVVRSKVVEHVDVPFGWLVELALEEAVDGMEQAQHQVHSDLLVEEDQDVVVGVRVLHAEFAAVAYAPVGWLALVELTVFGIFKKRTKINPVVTKCHFSVIGQF